MLKEEGMMKRNETTFANESLPLHFNICYGIKCVDRNFSC